MNFYVLCHGCGIGDLMLMAPLIAGLKHSSSDATVTCIASPTQSATIEWLIELGLVDRMDIRPFSLPNILKQLSRVAGKRCATVISAHALKSSKINWVLTPFRQLTKYSLSHRDQPTIERWLTGVNHIQAGENDVLRDVYAGAIDRIAGNNPDGINVARTAIDKWVMAQPQSPSSGFRVGLHLGSKSGFEVKTLNIEGWAPLIRQLREQGASFSLFGGAGEDPTAKQYLSQPQDEDFVGKLSIRETAKHISQCDLFVCNDGGPMQIAGLLNIPTIAFFGPTDPVRYHPLTNRFKLIEPDCWCRHTSKNVGELVCPNSEGPVCRSTELNVLISTEITKWLSVENVIPISQNH